LREQGVFENVRLLFFLDKGSLSESLAACDHEKNLPQEKDETDTLVGEKHLGKAAWVCRIMQL
jgi:hypothetical protein